jgi:hypothetical protein
MLLAHHRYHMHVFAAQFTSQEAIERSIAAERHRPKRIQPPIVALCVRRVHLHDPNRRLPRAAVAPSFDPKYFQPDIDRMARSFTLEPHHCVPHSDAEPLLVPQVSTQELLHLPIQVDRAHRLPQRLCG